MMERFLDIHMYITAALQKTDMRAVGLHLAMDLLYEKVEIISHNTNEFKALNTRMLLKWNKWVFLLEYL